MPTLALLLSLITTPIASPVQTANLSCGIPPIPPVGCDVGPCVCDSRGNCSWQFICD